jgi:hypothetical protein
MTLEPNVMGCEGANVDQAHEICLAWLDIDLKVLRVVHKGRLRHGLSTRGVLDTDELLEQGLDGLMVPVRQSDDDLLIVLALVRAVGIMDNDRAAQTLGVLAVIVGVVPICSRLVKLREGSA